MTAHSVFNSLARITNFKAQLVIVGSELKTECADMFCILNIYILLYFSVVK